MTPAAEGRSRIATHADLDALFECYPRGASPDVNRRAHIESAVDRGHCILWDDNSQVVGFVVTLPSHFYGHDFVDLLVVSESHRRRGIGRSLMRSVVESVAPADVWTSTNETNLAMRGLLASEEWHFSGTLRGLDEDDAESVFYLRGIKVFADSKKDL